MATVLDLYHAKQADIRSQIEADSLPPESLLIMQELNYRVSVLETFRCLCQAAPETTDVRAMGYHFQLVDASMRFAMTERRFGPKTDAEGQKKRETALLSLQRVVENGKKQFSSFNASSQTQYKTTIHQYVNAVLSVWMQYRNTYVSI